MSNAFSDFLDNLKNGHSNFFKHIKRYPYIYKENFCKDSMLKELVDDIKSFRYSPSPPQKLLYRDKGSGSLRIIPCFSVRDYYLYFSLVKNLVEGHLLENKVEGTFGGYILGGDIVEKENEEYERSVERMRQEQKVHVGLGYMYEYDFSRVESLKAQVEYSQLIIKTVEENPNLKNFFGFDIANFYDSINLNILESKLRSALGSENTEMINLLMYFLRSWNKKNDSWHERSVGLPQDLGDASRLLANFYIHSYDQSVYKFCDMHDMVYIRFSDDQIILSADSYESGGVIPMASVLLNKLNLQINSQKAMSGSSESLSDYFYWDSFSVGYGVDVERDGSLVGAHPNAIQKSTEHILQDFFDESGHNEKSKRKMFHALCDRCINGTDGDVTTIREGFFDTDFGFNDTLRYGSAKSIKCLYDEVFNDIEKKSFHSSFTKWLCKTWDTSILYTFVSNKFFAKEVNERIKEIELFLSNFD